MRRGFLGASVARDQRWIAVELVDVKPGDVLHIRFGEFLRVLGRFDIPLGVREEIMNVIDIHPKTGECRVERARLGTRRQSMREGLDVWVHQKGGEAA
jgi:hypothetical protein